MSAGHTNKRRHVGAPAASAGIGTQAATPLPVPGSDDELMPRARAAALLSDLWGGVRVAQRSLASWPVPYRIIGHASLYRRGDLLQYRAAQVGERTGANRRRRDRTQVSVTDAPAAIEVIDGVLVGRTVGQENWPAGKGGGHEAARSRPEPHSPR